MEIRDLTPAILAGGLGTRLRDALPGVPKPLAPVVGRPFLTYVLDQLQQAGFRDVLLLTGYLADEIIREFGDRYRDLALRYSTEPFPLGTGGALRAALSVISTPFVLLMNGDSFLDLNLLDLIRFHRQHDSRISLALARVDDVRRFGMVRLDADDRVLEFAEKPPSMTRGWINAGVYVFDRAVVEAIPAATFSALEHDVLPDWVNRGSVFGLRCQGRFIDIGTPESLACAAEFFFQSEREVMPGVH